MRTIYRLLGGALVLAAAVCASAAPPRSSSDSSTAPKRKPIAARSKPTAPAGPLAEIQAALTAGDARRAIALSESQTLQLSPAERFSIAGQAHLLLGDYAEARRKMEAALRQRPGHAADHYWLGRVHEAAGMPALASASFEDAAWNGLDTADLHYHWALTLRSMNELLGKISQQSLKGRHAKAPPAPGAFALGGLVVGTLPNRPGWVVVSPPNSAIYHALRAADLDPRRGDVLLLCGQIWAAVNRPEQAVAFFAKAAPLLPQDKLADCYDGWSAGLLTLGDLDGYLEQVKAGRTARGDVNSSELARHHDVAALAAAQRGDAQRQIRYLMQGVELDPTGVDRLIALADVLMQVQRVDDADRYLRTALQQNPSRKQKKEIGARLQRATYLAAPR